MKNSKFSGSFYTPIYLANFIIDYISPKFKGHPNISILEPSVGDGVFIESFNNSSFPRSIKHFSFTGVEKFKTEIDKATDKSIINNNKRTIYRFVHGDFLNLRHAIGTNYSLIVGNPPYINKNRLSHRQRKLCQRINEATGLNEVGVKNIWSAFLLQCSLLLDKHGILAFVLPAEFLQVTFAHKIRSYLISRFDRIEVFTFNELLFESIGQKTIVLVCYKQAKNKGQYYTRIKNRKQLTDRSFKLQSNAALVGSDVKWSHHYLPPEDIDFLIKVKNQFDVIGTYCDTKPGIVTAANQYFIVNSEREKRYNLTRFTMPILQKGGFVNGSVVFDDADYEKIISDGKPSRLLCLPKNAEAKFNSKIRLYLKQGKAQNIKERYKCNLRDKWFAIPNIDEPPVAFFFKRAHHYPKIMRNDAKVLVTDSAYMLKMKDGYSINDLIFSFYNSLTLSFAELEGRNYGGGVLELTPREFRQLPIPLVGISSSEFEKYRGEFTRKTSIDEFLQKYDHETLCKIDGIDAEMVRKIQALRRRLVGNRLGIR